MSNLVHNLARDRIKALLGRLALHCPPKRMSPQQFALLQEDYLSDLAAFPITAIERACNEWRLHGTGHYPAISDLVHLVDGERAENERRLEADTARRRGQTSPPPSGRFVRMTEAERQKIMQGMQELASRNDTPMRAVLLKLGETMLARGEVWEERK